jgi:hypothetical protein
MTTPPDPNTIAAVVEIGHKVRDAAELAMSRLHLKYWIGILSALCVICYSAYRVHGWYESRVAKLEEKGAALEIAKQNEEALLAVYKKRDLARVDIFRVDTVRVRQFIYRTKTLTVQVPVRDTDGVTYSAVPMDVVAKADFDSLGALCERTQHDCASVIASKDTIIEHTGKLLAIADSSSANYKKRLSLTNRANFWTKVEFGGGGFGLGFTTGYAAASLSCRR